MKTLNGDHIAVFGLLIVFSFSIYFFYRNKTSMGLIFLMAGAFLLRLFVYSMDPFLYDWDERFHALVGSNMAGDPFKPVLQINPVLPYDYKDWSNNYIWVHKQPLPTWLIAISVKIFGATELAVRLPSALMGSILPFFAYRIARNCFADARISVFAAFLVAFSFYQIELGAGRLTTDHNDVAFCFFVTASIWAFAEYYKYNSVKWALWVGVFSGLAILCKWLSGGIVYAGWMIILVTAGKKPSRNQLGHLFIAGATTLAIFLPWQIYISIRFPVESAYERSMVTRHLTEVIEGHEHGSFFYIDEMRHHYGRWLVPFLAAGLVLMFVTRHNRRLKFAISGIFLVCYLFFSLIPKTKMWSFTFMVAPVAFIMTAAGIVYACHFLNRYLKLNSAVIYYAVLLFAVISLKPWEMIRSRKHDPLRRAKLHNTKIYRSLPDSLSDPRTVLFNCKGYEDIDIMFYRRINSYSVLPTEQQLNELLEKGYRVYTFNEHHDQGLPPYMRNNSQVKIIEADIW